MTHTKDESSMKKRFFFLMNNQIGENLDHVGGN